LCAVVVSESRTTEGWLRVESTKQRALLRSARCEDSERGSALLGVLSVVVILGILVVIALSANLGSSPSTVGSTTPGETTAPTTTTVPQSVANGAQVATVSACQANFAEIQQVVEDYKALNGSNPPPGTRWATASSSGDSFIQAWPSGAPSYSITWNGTAIGVVPTKGRPSYGSVGVTSPASGCFAT
jgi:Tfp pilus assembly protein PilX